MRGCPEATACWLPTQPAAQCQLCNDEQERDFLLEEHVTHIHAPIPLQFLILHLAGPREILIMFASRPSSPCFGRFLCAMPFSAFCIISYPTLPSPDSPQLATGALEMVSYPVDLAINYRQSDLTSYIHSPQCNARRRAGLGTGAWIGQVQPGS